MGYRDNHSVSGGSIVMRIGLGLLVYLASCTLDAESATKASAMDENKLGELFAKSNSVEKFKQRVNFDQLVSREDPHTRVCGNWPQLAWAPIAQGMSVAGPEGSVSTLAYDKDQARFRWVLSGGTNMATVYAVDALTAAGARRLFMDNAEGNSIMDIPYAKGPANLGTVSAISKDGGAGYTKLFWIYRNMYFEINARGTVDMMALARFIQKHAERSLQPVP